MTIPFDYVLRQALRRGSGSSQEELQDVLCAGQTHIYRVGSTRCDCGAQANNPPIVGMYPFPPSYVPNPHHPRMQPPPAEPEIPASVKAKAIEVNATHLSKDWKVAYQLRFGKVRWAEWLGDEYGSWFPFSEELPEGAVEVE